MKHVSFALRLSYETCFVNREFIDFLDLCRDLTPGNVEDTAKQSFSKRHKFVSIAKSDNFVLLVSSLCFVPTQKRSS